MSWVRAPHRTPNWKENDFYSRSLFVFPGEAGYAFCIGLLFSGSCGIRCRQCSSHFGFVILAAGNAFSFLVFVILAADNDFSFWLCGIRYRRGPSICVPCSKRLPGVRDAFSEAFGVKKQAFPVQKGYSVRRTAFCGTRRVFLSPLLWYGTDHSVLKKAITGTTQKQDKSCDLSFLVAGAGLEPTTSGL